MVLGFVCNIYFVPVLLFMIHIDDKKGTLGLLGWILSLFKNNVRLD